MWFLHFNSLEQMITKNMASLKVDMHNLEFLEVKEKKKKPASFTQSVSGLGFSKVSLFPVSWKAAFLSVTETCMNKNVLLMRAYSLKCKLLNFIYTPRVLLITIDSG